MAGLPPAVNPARPLPARPMPVPVPLPPAADQAAAGPAKSQPAAPQPAMLPPAANGSGSSATAAAAQPRPSAPRPVPAPEAARPLPVKPGSAPVPIPVDKSDPTTVHETEEDTSTEEEIKRFALKNAPPWAVSTAIHMVLIIILGIWTLVPRGNPNKVSLEATYAEELGEQLDDAHLTADMQQNLEDAVATVTDLPAVDDPFSAPLEVPVNVAGELASSSIAAPVVGSLFSGRDVGSKQKLLGDYGGSKQTEDAVVLGLEWLAKHQRRDGTWSMREPYPDGSTFENVEAATAMALLAFQGNGITHINGHRHSQVVDKGIKALLRAQDADGNFFHGERRDEWLYAQAQCTIVLCELLAMTGDTKLREPAERAVQFCIDAQEWDETAERNQRKGGGWRYAPRRDSDTSVTGWMAMAMQSARYARIYPPEETFERLSHYLDMASRVVDAEEGVPVLNDPYRDGALYGYMVGSHPDRVMTAEANLCRQYLGWAQDDPRLLRAADYLMDHLPHPSDRDVYYWYYGTQFMFHLDAHLKDNATYWPRWNVALRDQLVGSQVTKGPQRGSWNPMGDKTDGSNADRWCALGHGGRLYATCLSIYMLEVYYRHLPIYSDLKKQADQKFNASR